MYTCWSKWPRGLRSPLACWDCGLEIPPRHWCLSLWRVVCCHSGSLRRTDHWSRGILLSVVCLSVVLKLRQREGLSPLGLSNLRKCIKKQADKIVCTIICTFIHSTLHVLAFKFAPEKRVWTGLVFRHNLFSAGRSN